MFISSLRVTVIGLEMILAKVLVLNRYLAIDSFSNRSHPEKTMPPGIMTPAVGSKATTADPTLFPECEVIIKVKLCANAVEWQGSGRACGECLQARDYSAQVRACQGLGLNHALILV
jgi:hypothetical protein